MGQRQQSLADNFLDYFDVAFATTEAQKIDIYSIRYRVYCEEFGYEPFHLFPDQQETDGFDVASVYALVTHRGSGMPAGCVRLVSPMAVEGADSLPFEQNCGDSLDRPFIDGLKLDRASVCEISRLAVDGSFRRRAGEQVTRYGKIDGLDSTQQERRAFAMIAVACFLAATALTDLTGRTNVFAMMEPFLPRLLARSGIVFTRAGQDIDYHGLRAPYFITTQSAIDNMRPDLRELYNAIHARMAEDFQGIE